MKTWILAINSVIGLYSVTAHGAWSSSGGGLNRTANNPWFINENTKIVSYCVVVDSKHFPYSDDEVDKTIQAGVSYWKKQASLAHLENGISDVPLVTAQVFQRITTCDEATIKFQFGFLTTEQKQNIPEFRSFLSLAVMTDYDVTNLRGRGFLYFAPETGQDIPSANFIRQKFWSFGDGLILRDAIFHELGHVFGVEHRGEVFNLMNEFHLEWLALPKTLPDNPTFFEARSMTINPYAFHTECIRSNTEFFSGKSSGCIFLTKEVTKPEVRVEWAATLLSPRRQTGVIVFSPTTSGISGSTAAYLRLPEAQRVFASGGHDAWPALIIHEDVHSMGSFVDATAKENSLFISLEARRKSIRISGVDAVGILRTLVDWEVIWD